MSSATLHIAVPKHGATDREHPLVYPGNDIDSSSSDASSRPSNAPSAYAAVSRALAGALAFMFKRPVRLFRPVKISTWAGIQAIAEEQGRSVTPGFVRGLLRKEGWRFFPKHVLPPLAINATIGLTLFTAYTTSGVAPHSPLRLSRRQLPPHPLHLRLARRCRAIPHLCATRQCPPPPLTATALSPPCESRLSQSSPSPPARFTTRYIGSGHAVRLLVGSPTRRRLPVSSNRRSRRSSRDDRSRAPRAGATMGATRMVAFRTESCEGQRRLWHLLRHLRSWSRGESDCGPELGRDRPAQGGRRGREAEADADWTRPAEPRHPHFGRYRWMGLLDHCAAVRADEGRDLGRPLEVGREGWTAQGHRGARFGRHGRFDTLGAARGGDAAETTTNFGWRSERTQGERPAGTDRPKGVQGSNRPHSNRVAKCCHREAAEGEGGRAGTAAQAVRAAASAARA
ncbi:RHTO0S11e05776g1_1 [Rhodotorula toruloides]|uniref:RHTO0S11e05776g1_1 n=1 Tax=Rhodotorula toruloides TaxID=5286 RepID=A0A061B7I4_RHOTO|nr:RHTO0S11e05776g1_1 [Rhodotorula toruloides]